LPIANMTCLDQRVSDMRAANRRALADLGHHLRFAHRHTEFRKLRKNTGQPAQPAVAYSSHLGGQARTRRIRAVRQYVHAAAATRAGEFHSAYHIDAQPLPLRHCFIQAVEGVVISQPDYIESGRASLTHQLRWRVRPIGDRGVSVQIDPHTPDLSRFRLHRTALILTTGASCKELRQLRISSDEPVGLLTVVAAVEADRDGAAGPTEYPPQASGVFPTA
jgi:hypothetical protein